MTTQTIEKENKKHACPHDSNFRIYDPWAFTERDISFNLSEYSVAADCLNIHVEWICLWVSALSSESNWCWIILLYALF